MSSAAFPILPDPISTFKNWSIKLTSLFTKASLKDEAQTITGSWQFSDGSDFGQIRIAKETQHSITKLDNKDRLELSGGIKNNKESGARLILFGNEHSSNPGNAYLDAGNISGAKVRLRVNDVTRLTVGSTLNESAVDMTVPDEVYGAGWNGSLEVPTKNAVYDKIETVVAGGGYSVISSGWTMSNVTSDKVLNANATSVNELADVLGTLINDMKTAGILS